MIMRWKIMALSLLASALVLVTVLSSNPTDAAQEAKNPKPMCADMPLQFFGFWGYGDFRGLQGTTSDGGKVFIVPRDHTMKKWSGYSRQWQGTPFALGKYNTFVVQVVGSDTFINPPNHDPKLMKWFVHEPGGGEFSLITSNGIHRSSDPAFVLPVDGRFEYPLPPEILKAGKIGKIGVTFLQGGTYGNVGLRAWFACR
jgi:hypothetical protein